MKNQNEFELENWYKNHYSQVNATAISGSFASRILHKSLEKPFKSNSKQHLLEVGSNVGEHLSFVANDYSSYLLTDIRPLDGKSILDEIRTRAKRTEIDFQIADVQALPFQNEKFDRVISTCVFHHLDDPLEAFYQVRRVTKIGGTISILIPNDPGVLYRFLRNMTTVRMAKKEGLYEESRFLHAIQHRNHYLQLRTLLGHVFGKDEIRTTHYPLKIESYNLNAISVFHINKK